MKMGSETATGWRVFMFVVYVLFGVLAAITAMAGIVMLMAGMPGGGVIALVIAAVLTFMSISVKKSLSEVAPH